MFTKQFSSDVQLRSITNKQQTKMAREKQGREVPAIDMNHGFVQSIIRNQIDRDEYDKDQRILKLEKERQLLNGEAKEERNRREKRAPLHQVYVPPHMRKASTNTEQSTSTTSSSPREPELLLRLEFEGKDGKVTYLNINKGDDLKKSVRQFAAANGLDSRLRDALYHKLYLELRET